MKYLPRKSDTAPTPRSDPVDSRVETLVEKTSSTQVNEATTQHEEEKEEVDHHAKEEEEEEAEKGETWEVKIGADGTVSTNISSGRGSGGEDDSRKNSSTESGGSGGDDSSEVLCAPRSPPVHLKRVGSVTLCHDDSPGFLVWNEWHNFIRGQLGRHYATVLRERDTEGRAVMVIRGREMIEATKGRNYSSLTLWVCLICLNALAGNIVQWDAKGVPETCFRESARRTQLNGITVLLDLEDLSLGYAVMSGQHDITPLEILYFVLGKALPVRTF